MKPGYKPLLIFAMRIVALLLTFSVVQPAAASVLAQALEHAWLLHPQAAALDVRADEAQARAEWAARLTPAPAAVSLAHLNDQLGDARGKREWEVEFAAPLWLPGQKAAQVAEAARFGEDVATRRVALRLHLAGQLRAAWWALAAARQADDLAQRRLNSARSLEVEVLRRFQAGDLPRIDANTARGETLAAQADQLAAEAAQREADRAWRALTGLAIPSHLAAETLVEPAEHVMAHPDLLASDSVLRLAHAHLNQVRTTRWDAPELALRLQRERDDNQAAYGNAIGVKLTIPLAAGPRLRRDEAAARADSQQAEAEQRHRRRTIALAIEQARFDLVTSQQQVDLAQSRYTLSRDSLMLAEKSFALGESNLTALLRARAAAFEAEAGLNRTTTARHQAVSQLKQAQGEMP